MDAEYFEIDDVCSAKVNKAKAAGKNVCAVGTTSMRSIESAVSATNNLKPSNGWTNLFIYPPHEFSIANMMLTNFHLPKSSLVIMASAFAGIEFTMEAYQEAIKEKYNFYSYGDAMLII
jgi:S-adenosylmethionine:tRNA ribosyltransferase-isomerase